MTFELKEGIYVSSNDADVFYPPDGNDDYFQLEDKSFWFLYRNKVISFFIKKYLPISSTFLDAGGGNGYVSREVQQRGYDVTLLESGPGVFNARQRGIKKIFRGNILNFDVGMDFSGIGLFDVVEHIGDIDALYSSVRKLLKHDGFLFLTVPAYNWLWSKEDIDARHLRRYTKGSIENELKENGFEIVSCSYFFSILVPLIFLFRSIPYLLGATELFHYKKEKGTEHKNFASGMLLFLLQIELYFLKHIRIPLGASLVVVAKKK